MYFDPECRQVLFEHCKVPTKDISTECPQKQAALKRKQPQLPKSAYFLYSQQRRKELKQKRPKIKLQKLITDGFRNLSEEEQEPWHEEANQAKVEYEEKVNQLKSAANLEISASEGVPVADRVGLEELYRTMATAPAPVHQIFIQQRLVENDTLSMETLQQEFRQLEKEAMGALETADKEMSIETALARRAELKRCWDPMAGYETIPVKTAISCITYY